MFCRNCGNEMADNAAVCVNCGVAAGQGVNFCHNCGANTNPNANVCTQCGVALSQPVPAGEQKSKLVAGILGILLGSVGAHNFYLGNTGKAVAQLLISLLTCGACAPISAIWGLVEGIMILTGSIDKDSKGIPLKD